MNARQGLWTAVLLAAATAGWAQAPAAVKPQGQSSGAVASASPRERQRGGRLSEECASPELIMENQQALGLSEEQKTAFKEIIRKSGEQFTDLEWKESAEREAVRTMLKQAKVDEAKTLESLDKLLKVENEIKRMRLATLIKVKNILTPEQQTKLRALKQSMVQQFQGESHGHGQDGRRGGQKLPTETQAKP